MEEKEKIGKKKNYHQNSVVSWRQTRVISPCRGWHDASKASLEGEQRPLGDAGSTTQKVRAPPTCLYLLCTRQLFFLFIKRP